MSHLLLCNKLHHNLVVENNIYYLIIAVGQKFRSSLSVWL